MKAIAADPGRRQRFEQYDNLAWLNVKFQDVVPSKSIVHSTKTGEADGAEQTASQEKAEWTIDFEGTTSWNFTFSQARLSYCSKRCLRPGSAALAFMTLMATKQFRRTDR